MFLCFNDKSHKGPNPQLDIWVDRLYFLKASFQVNLDLHGKGVFLLCYQVRPTNFLVNGLFYKLVHFAREGQESVGLRFLMETQWPLGSGGSAVPSQCDSRSVDSLVGQRVWASASLTWGSAQGRLQREGADAGWISLAGRSLTSWRLRDCWEQNGHELRSLSAYRDGEIKVVHLDASSARLNGCEWNNLPATFSICSSMLR